MLCGSFSWWASSLVCTGHLRPRNRQGHLRWLADVLEDVRRAQWMVVFVCGIGLYPSAKLSCSEAGQGLSFSLLLFVVVPFDYPYFVIG